MPTSRPGCVRPLRERGDRDRRGVRREHAVVADDAFELAEQAALGLEVLDDRLDDEACAGGVVEAFGDGDARGDRLRLGGVEPAFGGQAVERRRELAMAAAAARLARVEAA